MAAGGGNRDLSLLPHPERHLPPHLLTADVVVGPWLLTTRGRSRLYVSAHLSLFETVSWDREINGLVVLEHWMLLDCFPESPWTGAPQRCFNGRLPVWSRHSSECEIVAVASKGVDVAGGAGAGRTGLRSLRCCCDASLLEGGNRKWEVPCHGMVDGVPGLFQDFQRSDVGHIWMHKPAFILKNTKPLKTDFDAGCSVWNRMLLFPWRTSLDSPGSNKENQTFTNVRSTGP